MLSQPAPFPFAGSIAFERLTGRQVTILQLRGDGRALCRRDDLPRANAFRSGPAEGNCTIELTKLFETAQLARKGDRRQSAARRTGRLAA